MQFKPQIINKPPFKKFKEVQFIFTNPTASDISVNLFDSDASPLETNSFVPATTFTNTIITATTTYGSCFNPINNFIYITGLTNVYVIDCSTDTITTTINIPSATSLTGIAYNSTLNEMYVCDDGYVFRIDCVSNVVVGVAINVGGIGVDSKGICFDSVNNRMYVSNSNINRVKVINCVTNLVIANIIVGTFPIELVFNPVNSRIYVANNVSDNISMISTLTNTVVGSVSTGAGSNPSSIAYNSTSDFVYITCITSNDVRLIDCSTNILSGVPIPVGLLPEGIVYNENLDLMYVSNNDSGTVSVIDCDSGTVTNTVVVGSDPIGISYNSISNSLYASSDTTTSVYVVGDGLQFYVAAFPNYNQFTTDVSNNPKTIKQITFKGSSQAQTFEAVSVLVSDANGQRYSEPRFPLASFSVDQFQNTMSVVNFDEGELVLSSNGGIISNYTIKANSSISMLLSYNEIKKIDLIYGGHKSILEKLVDQIAPNADTETAHELDFNSKDKPYIRPLWEQPFSTTKIASEMIEKQLADARKLMDSKQ